MTVCEDTIYRLDTRQIGQTGNETVNLGLKHKEDYRTPFGSDPIGDQEVYFRCLSYVVLSFLQVYKMKV